MRGGELRVFLLCHPGPSSETFSIHLFKRYVRVYDIANLVARHVEDAKTKKVFVLKRFAIPGGEKHKVTLVKRSYVL